MITVDEAVVDSESATSCHQGVVVISHPVARRHEKLDLMVTKFQVTQGCVCGNDAEDATRLNDGEGHGG